MFIARPCDTSGAYSIASQNSRRKAPSRRPSKHREQGTLRLRSPWPNKEGAVRANGYGKEFLESLCDPRLLKLFELRYHALRRNHFCRRTLGISAQCLCKFRHEEISSHPELCFPGLRYIQGPL